MTARGKSHGKAGMHVHGGDKVSSRTLNDLLDGIEGQALSWSEWNISFGLPGLCFPWDPLLSPSSAAGTRDAHPHPGRIISDEATDGRHRRAVELLLVTELLEFRVDLLLSQVWMLCTNDLDHPDDLDGPETDALLPRRTGFGVQGF